MLCHMTLEKIFLFKAEVLPLEAVLYPVRLMFVLGIDLSKPAATSLERIKSITEQINALKPEERPKTVRDVHEYFRRELGKE